jgi:hypothetical protein
MKDYTAPVSSAQKAGKPEKKKDPNAPKRATTSFFAFSNDVRKKIHEENPELGFGELGKKIGELFRQLSAQEKEKYEEMALEDKKRYKREMKAYEASKQGGDDDEDDSDADGLNDAADDDDDDESDSD